MGYLEIIWIAEPGGPLDAGKRGGASDLDRSADKK